MQRHGQLLFHSSEGVLLFSLLEFADPHLSCRLLVEFQLQFSFPIFIGYT